MMYEPERKTIAEEFIGSLTAKEIEMLTGPIGSPSTWSGSSISTLGSGTRMSATANYRQDIVCGLVQEGYWVKATGSRVTKSGYTSESDWDYVVYDPDHTLSKKLENASNWIIGGSGNGEEFSSFKNGLTNLILTDKEDIWKKYIIATNLIKSLDCRTKKERIAIFGSVFERDRNLQAVEF